MPQLGPLEIVVVLIVALMVFGPKRLPEVGRQVGHGLRELRKIQETVRAEINDVLHAPDAVDSSRSDAPTYRTSGTPTPVTGRPAPSRFRAAVGPVVTPAALGIATDSADAPGPDTVSDSSPAGPERGSGTRAPSRFRAPGA